jgi:phospholipid transport system substrate-binding protein
MRIARLYDSIKAGNPMKRLIASCIAAYLGLMAYAPANAATGGEPPDLLVRVAVDETLAIIRDAKDPQTLRTLAEQKVLPFFDFRQMTQTAAGRTWREATPAQQQQLENGFRSLLVNTYTAALSRTTSAGKTVEVKPLPASVASQSEALVRTTVRESGKPPVAIDYRMAKTPAGWKVVDVTIENISLVTNYRSTFQSEVARSGIDGLIKALEEKSRSPTRGGMG